MSRGTPWYDVVSLPALLRHARNACGTAMRQALAQAGHDDIPKNGLYVIGGLALGAGNTPLSRLIEDLRISKQSAGQLVDALVTRGYLDRAEDPQDRRKLIVTLTARGRAAAAVQAAASRKIDALLAKRIGQSGVDKLRRMLAELAEIDPHAAGPRLSESIRSLRTTRRPEGNRVMPGKSSKFENTSLVNAHFRDVNLRSAQFIDVNLADASFSDVSLAGTRFHDVNFSHAAITDANLNGMTINGILVTELLHTYAARARK